MDGDTSRSTAAWDALRCAAWEQARDAFEHLLSVAESPATHEGLSWALWWLNDGDAVIAARETAYRLYRDSGDAHGAARMAVWLASDVLDFRGEPAISGAWIERAHRLLDGCDLSPEHGWLDLHEGTIALDLEGDSTTARRLGDRCAGTGRELGVVDLEMLGMALSGQAAVHEGDVREGMRLLDQAALSATTGELDELVAVGWSCCSLIKAASRSVTMSGLRSGHSRRSPLPSACASTRGSASAARSMRRCSPVEELGTRLKPSSWPRQS